MPRREDPDPRVFLTFEDRTQHEEWKYLLKSPWYSAFLSALFMGAGQIYNGQGRRGLVFLLAEVSLLLYGWDHFYGQVVSVAIVSWFGSTLYNLFFGLLAVGGLVVWAFNVYDAHEVARFVSFIYDRHSQILDPEEESERFNVAERSIGIRRGRTRQVAFLAAVVLAYTAGIFFLGSRVGGGGDGLDGLKERLATATNPDLHLSAGEFFLGLERLDSAREEFVRALRYARTASQRRAAELGLAKVDDLEAGRAPTPPAEVPAPPAPAVPSTGGDPGGEIDSPGLFEGSGPPPDPGPEDALVAPPTTGGRGVDLEFEYALERAELELSVGNPAGAEEALAPLANQVSPSARLEWVRGEIARARGELPTAQAYYQRALDLGGEAARAHLGLARVARAEGDGAQEEGHLAQAAASAPEDPEVVRAYSDLLLERGRAEEAHEVVARALTGRPDDHDLLYRAFVLSRQAGNTERAHEAARALARAEYRDGEVYAFLARRALEQGDLEEARRHATTLRMTDPRHPDALLLEGEVLRRLRRPAEAVKLLEPHIGSGSLELAILLAQAAKEARTYPPGIRALEAAFRVHPPTPPAAKLLGILRKRTGDFPGALEAYEQSLAIDPGDKEALYLAGYIHIRMNQFDKAVARFRKVHAAHPGYGETDFYLGRALEGRGDLTEALEAYQRVPQGSPNLQAAQESAARLRESLAGGAPPSAGEVPDSRVGPDPVVAPSPGAPATPGSASGGVAFPAPHPPPPPDRFISVDEYAPLLKDAEIAFTEGRMEEALDLYRQVLGLKPDHFRSHFQAGVILRELGRKDEALGSFQLARSLEPQDLKTLAEIGQLLYEQGSVPQSITVFEEALRIDPKHLAVRYKLGVVYENQENYAKAEEQYQAILWYHPEYTRAQDYLGNVYYKQEKFTRAAGAFRAILQANPEDHRVRFKLALTYLKLGDVPAAEKELEHLTRVLPEGHEDLPQVRSALQSIRGR